MPFTASHPMAVLPLLRWRRLLRLDATCLVIGSMAPDFEYFVRLRPIMTISHTVRGLWQWSLPVTLVLAVLTHALVKWPMLLVAPTGLARRLVAVVGGPWQTRWSAAAVASCCASALLGALTHLIWDSFTHANRWGTEHFTVLTEQLKLPLLGPFAVHRLLQQVSTLVGAIVLAVVVIRRLRRVQPVALPDAPRAAARLCVAACVAAGIALADAEVLAMHAARRTAELGELVVGTISGTLAGLLVASAILLFRARRFHRAAGGLLPMTRSSGRHTR